MEGDRWVCTQFFGDEKVATITVKNKIDPARLTTVVEAWFYLEGNPHQMFLKREWVTGFGSGQSANYQFSYLVPTTGMQMDTRFFIAVWDEAGNRVGEKLVIRSL